MEYKVVRSKRKTSSLQIQRDGTLVVRAPLALSDAEIEKLVARHSAWIEKNLAAVLPPPRFSDGERVMIEGNPYIVATGKTALQGGTLYLPAEGREAALIALLKKRTRIRMKRLLDEVAARGGFTYSGLSVTAARTRWGSCSSKKRISFPFRTEFLPDDVAYYLAVHELCHTVEMNHSKAFWKLVQRLLPNYSALRKSLKGYRWALVCL